LQSW